MSTVYTVYTVYFIWGLQFPWILMNVKQQIALKIIQNLISSTIQMKLSERTAQLMPGLTEPHFNSTLTTIISIRGLLQLEKIYASRGCALKAYPGSRGPPYDPSPRQ